MRGFWAATEPSEVEIDFPFSPVRKWVCACQRMVFLHLPQSHLPPTPLISVPSSTSKQCGVIKLEALMERFLRRKRAGSTRLELLFLCCWERGAENWKFTRKLTGGGFSADAMLLEKEDEDILFLASASTVKILCVHDVMVVVEGSLGAIYWYNFPRRRMEIQIFWDLWCCHSIVVLVWLEDCFKL